MADKKKEEKNYKFFSKYNQESRPSKAVKPIEIWVMYFLKFEKENDKVFHCNDIAPIKSKICSISERQNFDIKKELAPTGHLQVY